MNQLLSERMERGLAAIASLGLIIAVGCGGSAASVSGTVSIDGKALVGSDTVRVTVLFFPESSGAPAAAKLDENGQYELSTGSQAGLPPGNYSVAISAKEITTGSQSARDLAANDYGDPQTSGLTAEVKPGSNTFDFDLKSKP
jgi:hypothetical protein